MKRLSLNFTLLLCLFLVQLLPADICTTLTEAWDGQFILNPRFTLQPLLAGKSGDQNNHSINREEVRFTNQSVFIQLQYKFRS